MGDSYFENMDFAMNLHKKHVSSKAKCFWKDCTRRIDPDQLFCSKSCQNKSYSWDSYSRMHQTALKYWEPNPAWYCAPQIDAGLWFSTMNPDLLKQHKHGTWWNECWATIFSRYGVAKKVPPIKRAPDPVDQALRASIPRGSIIPFMQTAWNSRNAGALAWPARRR